jgi:hypothetical protein
LVIFKLDTVTGHRCLKLLLYWQKVELLRNVPLCLHQASLLSQRRCANLFVEFVFGHWQYLLWISYTQGLVKWTRMACQWQFPSGFVVWLRSTRSGKCASSYSSMCGKSFRLILKVNFSHFLLKNIQIRLFLVKITL